MPLRLLRDWTMSDKVNELSVHAERFFTRLIMKADDHGCFHADTRLLKANLYPLLLDTIREADLLRWLSECQKAGLIVLYENDSKKYLQILDFRQRLDKARSKYPMISDPGSLSGDNETPAEVEPEAEVEVEKRAKALVVPPGTTPKKKNVKSEYEVLKKTFEGKERTEIWNTLKAFIRDKDPDFIEPYVDIWNLFACSPQLKLPMVEVINDSRRKKFQTRFKETGFDFLKILEKIKISGHLKGGNSTGWTVTFGWIIENDSNYIKILEGNYD